MSFRRAAIGGVLTAMVVTGLLAGVPGPAVLYGQAPAPTTQAPQPVQPRPSDQPVTLDAPPVFRSGVEIVNLSATVHDRDGRFVPNLTKDDFRIFEDGRQQTISVFNADRVPVSLGIILDTSGSMEGDKMREARQALDRFLNELLDEDDEVFLYRFSDTPTLVQGWTQDRSLIMRAIARIAPNGATALYDAVAQALPLAQAGTRRKKALLIISDGNDTSSETMLRDLRSQIRQSEVLVYAIGIDGDGQSRRAPLAPRGAPSSHPFARLPSPSTRPSPSSSSSSSP